MNRLLTLLIATMVLVSFSATTNAGTYNGGSGTESDPFRISTAANWQEMMNTSADWDKFFILTTDLDLAGVTLTPIAPDTDSSQAEHQGIPFTGTFDGNNRVIRNAAMNRPTIDYLGLFGKIGSGGQIKNLGMENARIKGRDYVGGMVGQSFGTIGSCNVIGGEVWGNDYIGGLIGWCEGNINDSYATSTVNGRDRVGGLIGINNTGAISACYATGTVTGHDYVGGLVGHNTYGGTISQCYTTGTVTGSSYVGGLAGVNHHIITDNCYATGTVTGAYDVGGLIGHNNGSTSIAVTSCWATGDVSSGEGSVGGLVGANYTSITSCYATGKVDGYSYSGGLVGQNHATITSCNAAGNVTGYYHVGGLAGDNYGIIINSHAIATVTCYVVNVGGLVGYQDVNGIIESSYAAGEVSGGGNNVGGLVGVNYHGVITSSYASVSVNGNNDNIGGLVGDNSGAIEFCYSLGTVNSTGNYIGGLIGINTGTIDTCYSAGLVGGGGSDVGGLVGYNDGWFDSILSSFWDTDTSGQAVSSGGTGRTTAEMKTLSTFTNAGWDFTAIPIWKITSQINDGYPSLAWQEPELIELTISSPNGGETFPVGTTKTITWNTVGEIANVQLSYSPDNGSTWNNIKTVPNTGSTTWTIPNTPSSECLLKISNADNADVFDISDAVFTIQSAYPVVTSPNGGEQLYTGTQRTIYWNTVGAISTILIEYSSDNGLNWTPVSPANVGNTKSYKWTVPYAVSDQCLIRVSDAANPSSFDISNAPFSILASKPTLLMPSGGENLLTGSNYDIRWATTGVIQNIAIEYSTNNGDSWHPVSPANTGNSGLYEWSVPHQVSDQCLVRISDADHPEVNDISESAFQIVSSLPALLSPNGGERLLSGSSVPIQWNTTGVISDILIEYSLDNGTSWIAVTPPNTGNTGSYGWTVPYEMSKECLVRVSDMAHPVVCDVSDAVFEISPLYLKTLNGKEKLLINSQSVIRWDSGEALAGDLMSIKYSTNNGQDWTDLGTTGNDGQYEWAVPALESNEYLVHLSFADHPDIVVISQDTFVVYQCYEQIAGDLDGDCMVGLSDFAIIAENWLNRGQVLIRDYTIDGSPNWTTEGQWEFGQPLGLGGDSYGNPDPNSGYTGQNVYGINLSGDYSTAVGNPYYLTTGPISCRHFSDIRVSFMSWLNIDSSNYVQCKFEVSSNGMDWVTLWSNTPDPITDNNWNKREFDISEYADDNPTLYLRWGYQIIDRAYPYSGWNIDDVELWGTL